MPPALAIPDRHSRTIQGLVRALLCIREKAHQMQHERLDELRTGAHQAVVLRAVGQSGESLAQVSLSVAVEIPLAGETAPTSKDGQGKYLALGEGGFGTGPPFWRLGVAEVVDHNVEYGEEGVHIEHKESVPFPWGSVSKPTLANGHLPLKFCPNNSHQAFIVSTKEVSRRIGCAFRPIRDRWLIGGWDSIWALSSSYNFGRFSLCSHTPNSLEEAFF
jgi:hypothetical protein